MLTCGSKCLTATTDSSFYSQQSLFKFRQPFFETMLFFQIPYKLINNFVHERVRSHKSKNIHHSSTFIPIWIDKQMTVLLPHQTTPKPPHHISQYYQCLLTSTNHLAFCWCVYACPCAIGWGPAVLSDVAQIIPSALVLARTEHFAYKHAIVIVLVSWHQNHPPSHGPSALLLLMPFSSECWMEKKILDGNLIKISENDIRH